MRLTGPQTSRARTRTRARRFRATRQTATTGAAFGRDGVFAGSGSDRSGAVAFRARRRDQ